MATFATVSPSPKSAPTATLLSLIVPGVGQLYLGMRTRGIAIFLTTILLGSLIYWSSASLQIALVTFGGATTSWLWLFLIGFWAWNVYDAYRAANHQKSNQLIAFVFAALIIYIIAWQVTDVHLDRLVTRIHGAQVILDSLVHPDLFVSDETGFHPSENFGDLIGRIEPKPVPKFLTQIGLASPGATYPGITGGSLIVTIATGLMATILGVILAIPFSFLAARNIADRLPGGTVIYYVLRTFLNFVRAVDPIIWGLIVVVWVGLGPFAGMLALTIHTIAALGKLISEEIEHIDEGPLEAVTASGATLMQMIRFAVIPQIIPSFLSYSLLRWDINMRSATVVGFVAGGGIGFFVVETIRKGGYEQYAAALWAVAVVIILVDYISAAWRQRVLIGETKVTTAPPKRFYKSPRSIAFIVAGLVVFIYCWQLTEVNLSEMLQPGPNLIQLLTSFATPDFSSSLLLRAVREMMTALFQALLATTFGGLLAIPFSFLAARNLTGRSRLSIWIYYATRFLFNFLRSIEALLYVAIFVFWVGIGPFAGMLALAVTTFALIGKLFSEAIENVDTGPLEAITATGATGLQVIFYGVLPQIVPPFVSYSIYQWDINVRISTIIALAGGGGIGILLNEFFGTLQYHKASTVVLLIVGVVIVMDFASAKIRERLV